MMLRRHCQAVDSLNVLQNVDINVLLIILHRIIFYAIYAKTELHVN